MKHGGAQEQERADNIEIVCKSLGFDKQIYCNLQHEEACRWLSQKFGKDYRVLNKIALLPLFWKWWINQWAMREKEFVRVCNLWELNEVFEGADLKMLSDLFFEVHEVSNIRFNFNVYVNREITDMLRVELSENAEFFEFMINKMK